MPSDPTPPPSSPEILDATEEPVIATTLEERRVLIHNILGEAMQQIVALAGEPPAAAVLVVQFPKIEDAHAAFAIAKVPPATQMKIADSLAARFAAEVRALKVQLNTARKPLQ